MLDRETVKNTVWKRLSTVMDPELNIDIVSLGLIYDVTITQKHAELFVHIVLTLTTPGCPLAGVFDPMIRSSLVGIEELNIEQSVQIDLVFDPPWTPDMMSEEARAELDMLL